MSGVALKITTLLIRTVSKPIAQRIKHQAREHEGFRRICVGWAQLIHRVDMRLRLGLLQDPAALERQAQREAAEAAKKKRIAEAPTVKTEAQTRAEAEAAKQDLKDGVKKIKEKEKTKIKPLSEAKAIDLGSNFIAESFLFAVAVGTVLFETWRSRKKERGRRDMVAEQLAELKEADEEKGRKIVELEREIQGLREHGHGSEGWHWPWQTGQNHTVNEEKGIGSSVLAQVKEHESKRKATTETTEQAKDVVQRKQDVEPPQASPKADAPEPISKPADQASDTTPLSSTPATPPSDVPTEGGDEKQ